MEEQTAPLKGRVLLQKVKELSDKPRRETAKLCGYYNKTKTGQTRVNLTEFYDAVLEAKGVPLDPDGGKDGRGREPTYKVSVHKNGQIVIGSTYTQAMGLEPGEEFEIKLGYKHIRLVHINDGSNGLDSIETSADVEDMEEAVS
jgi:bifunctional DNA-binding transcriptional regulator/antitoxin component of YhaV-PrlF toxin-antitoxin module